VEGIAKQKAALESICLMSRKVLHAQIITKKIFKNISNFVQENRYQHNVQNKPWLCMCALITHRGRQNVVRTPVMPLACGL